MKIDYLVTKLAEKLLLMKASIYRSRVISTDQSRDSGGFFFIVSCGRSGTTLLRKILVLGGQAHIPPESDDNLPMITKWYLQNLNKPWKDLVAGCLALFQNARCYQHWEVDLFNDVDDLLKLEQRNRTLYAIIKYIYSQHQKENAPNSTKIGDKTPFLILRLDWLEVIFPNAKFIHLVRDPRSVVGSRMRSFKEDFKVAMRRWDWAIKSFTKFMKGRPTSCLEVRYEDLVLKPEETIKKVCGFLDLTFSKSMMETSTKISLGDTVMSHHANTTKSIDPSLIRVWENELTQSQIQTIEINFQHEMNNYGYQK